MQLCSSRSHPFWLSSNTLHRAPMKPALAAWPRRHGSFSGTPVFCHSTPRRSSERLSMRLWRLRTVGSSGWQPSATALQQGSLFDKTAQKLHLSAHPLIKLKFPAADRLPFYNLNRERAAITATPIAASRPPSARSADGEVRLGSAAVRTESRLCSRDGRLVGRADHIDGRSRVVIDYKTGHVSEAEACAVSDSEARQLRLYAYLAAENGTDVGTGAVVRGDGQRCEFAISPSEAKAEADSAKKQLDRINAARTDPR